VYLKKVPEDVGSFSKKRLIPTLLNIIMHNIKNIIFTIEHHLKNLTICNILKICHVLK